MTGLMGQDNGKDGFDEMKDNRMDNIVECAYNMDNGYVEVWVTDVKCLFMTVVSVFKHDGVVEGGTGAIADEE